jgi:hypothetical protein
MLAWENKDGLIDHSNSNDKSSEAPIELTLLCQFLGAKSTSIRDCVRRLVGRSVPTMRDYVEK